AGRWVGSHGVHHQRLDQGASVGADTIRPSVRSSSKRGNPRAHRWLCRLARVLRRASCKGGRHDHGISIPPSHNRSDERLQAQQTSEDGSRRHGDTRALNESVTTNLFTLADGTLVYPAPDYQERCVSSVAQERKRNPRLGKGKELQEFSL